VDEHSFSNASLAVQRYWRLRYSFYAGWLIRQCIIQKNALRISIRDAVMLLESKQHDSFGDFHDSNERALSGFFFSPGHFLSILRCGGVCSTLSSPCTIT